MDEAVFFLCYIDEEKYFMLALYLDGVDPAFGVLRFVDAATHETAEFHMELTVYANTLRYLYMEGMRPSLVSLAMPCRTLHAAACSLSRESHATLVGHMFFPRRRFNIAWNA